MGKNTPVLKQGADAVAKPVNVLSDRNQTPMLPIDLRAVPLEPRVMLDANLEFDINASTALTSVLSSVAQLFDEQIADITDFLDTFDEAAGAAFDKISAIVDTVEGVSSQADSSGVLSGDIVDLSVAAETVQRIRDAIDALRNGVTDTITDLIADDFYADLAADVRSQLEVLNNDVPMPPDPPFVSTLSVADVTGVYTVDNFSSGAVDSTLDTLISGMDLGNATEAQVKSIFHDAVATAMGVGTENFSVTLNDIAVGGETLVSFTQDGDFAVDVAVNLPQAFADFQAVLQAAIPGISLPFDALSQGAGGSLVEFEIETHTTFSGDILTGLAVDIHEFAFAPLLEVGGTIGGVAGAGFNLGLLALEVTSLETAKFGLFVTAGDTGGGGMNLGGSIDVSGTPSVTWAGSSATLDVTARIQEIGATGYSDIVADQVYDLIDLDLEGELDFSAITQEFTAGITLTSVLDSTDAAGRLRAFIDKASFDFTLDLVNTGLAADQEKILEDSLVTLATMGTEQIVQFLKDIGETVTGALSDSAFDIAIPLTDVRFGNLMTELSSFFTDLASTFSIDKGALGLDTETSSGPELIDTTLTSEIDTQSGERMSLGQFTKLLDYNRLSLSVTSPGGTPVDVDINLTGTEVQNASLSLSARMTALADLLSVALSGHGIAVALGQSGGLSVTGTKTPGSGGNPATFNTFTVKSARKISGNSEDDTFSLFDLGFDTSNLTEVTEVFGEGSTEFVATFAIEASAFNLGALALDALDGVKNLRFTLHVDGEDQPLDVKYSGSGTGWTSLAELIDDLNVSLDGKGIGVTAGTNTGGDGLGFSLDLGEGRSFSLSADPDDLLRALDIASLMNWVNSELDSSFPGAALELTDDGELIFSFPDIEASLAISTDDGIGFSASDLGLGVLGDLDLSAQLSAQLNAVFSSAVGIDLVGFGKTIIGDSTAPDAPANALEGKNSFTDDLKDAVLDNVFFSDLSLEASASASATEITGSADIGLISVAIGADDAAQNFLHANAQFEANILGRNVDGEFNEKLTFRNLRDAVADKVEMSGGEPVVIAAPGISTLLGRFELLGGIVVNGDGEGLAGSGDTVMVSGDVVTEDAFEYAGDDELAQLLVRMGDVKVTVAGISGINENLIDGVSLSVIDLFDLTNTWDVALLSNDPAALEAIEGLANLENGDILDTLAAIGNVLVVVGETLSDKLPFLAADIPLLNFSVLDQINFASDFLNALQELRNDPQSGLDVIENHLEGVFGEDTVTLTWDADEKTILFDLSFKFLEDYQKTVPFQLDLVELLGDQLAGLLGEDLADVVSGLVDVSGDGELIFDPELSLDFSFGIDLSPTLIEPTVIAPGTTGLGALSTVSSLNFRPGGGNDLRVSWTDAETGTTVQVEVELDGNADLDTNGDGELSLDEAVVAIDEAVKEAIADRLAETKAEIAAESDPDAKAALQRAEIALERADVSFTYDVATGQITLSDTASEIIVTTGVNALFGLDEADSEEDDGKQVIALKAGFSDFAEEHIFTISINGSPVKVTIPAAAGRDSDGFVIAFNTALQESSVSRGAISDSAAPGITIALSNLMDVIEDAGEIRLQGTDFASAAGYDPVTFAVSGEDQSQNIEFRVTDLGGGNVARALGFEDGSSASDGDMVSEVLFEAVTAGAPRVYLDTEKTGITASFVAGVNDGLNIKLGLGPVEVQVQNGKALINAGDGTGDPAFLKFLINDIDGDDNEDQYDLSHLFDIPGDADLGFADLFGFDAKIGVDIELPLSDSLGLFDPAVNKLSWKADLLSLKDGVTLKSIDLGDLGASFDGDLVSLHLGDGIDMSNFEFGLPDLSDFLSNLNVLSLLNNPRLVLGGLDLLMDQMQTQFDDFLGGITLPVVGDAIGAGVSFFQDFRYNVLQAALDYANQPLEDGSLPTTVDLLTGFVNDALNDLLSTSGVEYLQAHLNTDGSTEDSYIYGVLNFNAIIFNEMMDIDFDFGIPGFNMEVEQGSQIKMQLDYAVNIGFGFDKNGFFLLNDTDDAEIGIDFTVDAGTFEGSMSVFNILGVSAKAVTLDGDGNIDESAGGTAELTASLEADLFGDSGLTIVDPTTLAAGEAAVTATQAYRDFSGVDPVDGGGAELTWEKVVYVAQLDTANLIAFEFSAEIDVAIGIEANILDPSSGEPVKVAGAQVIPSVNAELVFNGVYDTTNGLQLEKLLFNNVRLDASVLYDALIKPILDPIMAFIDPLADVFAFLNSEPISFIVDILGNVFPIIKLADTVATVVGDILNFVTTLHDNDGMVLFGTFDFTSSLGDMSSGETTLSDVDNRDMKRTGTTTASQQGPGKPFGVFGDTKSGFSLELPLLTDPFSAMSILTGNFDQVDLVRAKFTLFNLNTGVIDIGDFVLSSIGAPGWVRDIISSVFSATIEARLIAQFEAGYDLSGIVNFANSLDPERLLDGVFINAEPGSLVDVFIGASVNLNAGIAGLTARGHAGAQLSFSDPNNDGKLRIPELIALVEAAADEIAGGNPLGALETVFKGKLDYGFYLSVWAGISLPWPLPDLKWSTTVFDFGDTINFGGKPIPARMSGSIGSGETAILNIGARAGASMSLIEGDGNDVVTISGPNSPYNVSLTSGGRSISGTIDEHAGALVIPAGEGNNVIDMTAMTTRTASDGTARSVPTITYTGGGRDVIKLANTGLHVVFAGDGIDEITAGASATGTYIIFGEGDADTVDIQGGNVIYFGDQDFGMRDVFLAKFATGDVTETEILNLLGINLDGTVNETAAAHYTFGGEKVNLATLQDEFTAGTQLKAAKDVETVTVGNGNHFIMTGNGADQISTDLNGTGTVVVLSGGGADTIKAGGSDVFVEGGAGRDLIQVDGALTEVWGWGKAAGAEGLTATDVNLNSLALQDGADVIIGGSGSDTIYGQLGSDIIEGGLGEDSLFGGFDDDFVTGGRFDMSFIGGSSIDIANFDINGPLTRGLLIETAHLADGDDTIDGGKGADVLLGGGGSDTMTGASGNDILIGDFAEVRLSSNLIAEGAITTQTTSTLSGTDDLSGGMGNDILIAGAALPNMSETLVDLYGDNIFLGDFGEIKGARILEAATQVISIASTAGGADIITSGRGNDLVIGGEGADIIDTGLGGDLIIGDNGTLDITAGTISSVGLDTDGDDVITLGVDTPNAYKTDETPPQLVPAQPDLKDLVIGGRGNDTITATVGGLVAIGDAGVIGLNPVALNALRSFAPAPSGATQDQLDAEARSLELISAIAESVESTAHADDGNDRITATGGEVIAVLGGGADVVDLADGVNYILGDDGRITIDPNSEYTGRLIGMTTAESLASDNDDTFEAGNGVNILAGGEGADGITLGDGNNVVLGDSGTITHDTRGATPVITATSRTHGDDGVDIVELGAGDNIVIAGGAGDTITTGAGNNGIVGDSGSLSQTSSQTVISSLDPSVGGNDTVTTLGGNDAVVLGFGDDIANLGEGDNRVLGDNGAITMTATTTRLETSDDAVGGDDTVTTGAGHDFVALGAGADTANLGAGDNLALGDSGVISVAGGTTTLTTTTASAGGNDTITTLGGHDSVALGSGDDIADLGDGDNRVLGDNGAITMTATTTRLETSDDAVGGDDTVTTGAGHDFVALGARSDTANLGEGNNRVLGDSGVIFASNSSNGTVTTGSSVANGIDTITTLSGSDVVIGGFGGDVVHAGAGDNVVIGDMGQAVLDPGLVNVIGRQAETLHAGAGGNDDITTLGGSDVILAGGGSDVVKAGDGADVILGDDGLWGSSHMGGLGVVTAEILSAGGNDHITAGGGNDIVIANQGDDYVSVGEGEDVALGDDGIITFRNRTDVETVLLTNLVRGGEDVITAAGTVGDNILIGQAGADTITGGVSDDMIVGDIATILLEQYQNVLPGQSAQDRVIHLTGLRSDIAYDDTLSGDAGNDFIMGGFGNDLLHGNDGQDFLIGDTVIMSRGWVAFSDGSILEELKIDTNFAYLTGGYDVIFGDDGPDILVGGLGPDLFHGNTADDLIYSDGYAGLFRAEWGVQGFVGVSGQRFLYTSNFAGPGAIDVVSAAQQKDSIGSPLDLFAQESAQFSVAGSIIAQQFLSDGYAVQSYGSLTDPHFVSRVLDYLESDTFIRSVAELTATGADISVIKAAIRAALLADFGAFWEASAPAHELLIEQLIEYLLSSIQPNDETAASDALDDVSPSDETEIEYAMLRMAAE
ncbi:calcium-binding protein [Halocynthiibacter namhaensis]|uniref:calcium-binding protein n=1 Tax=Halocynthiibacter namhaensis TaxID=1290553 RepID=UPI0005797427|nr:calcium-binding protein [Halocynthiibacter namhaensis]